MKRIKEIQKEIDKSIKANVEKKKLHNYWIKHLKLLIQPNQRELFIKIMQLERNHNYIERLNNIWVKQSQLARIQQRQKSLINYTIFTLSH